MKHNQSTEDYLETILILSQKQEFVHKIDVARAVNVSQPAVQKAVKLLAAQGYITSEGMHIYLTESGKKYAEEIYARHCTLKKFLKKLGVSEENADADACEMEHILSEETYNKIIEFLEKQ
ncbi:MAG: metal-dependent transcriptional regulator [Clostridia bacterium]|nr:metal-dependent transcriptional regulator [Clostridia bacterium]